MKETMLALLMAVSTPANAETQADWNHKHLWANLNMQIMVRPVPRSTGHWTRTCVYIPQTEYCRCMFTDLEPDSVAGLLIKEIFFSNIDIDMARRDRAVCEALKCNSSRQTSGKSQCSPW